MYRLIRIHEDDYKFQQIVWRNSSTEPLSTFMLKTVNYGTSAAPFLATRCVKQLGIDHRAMLPIAANAIENDICVDDVLTGANSIAAALELKHQITNIFQSAGMELKKWCSNRFEITEDSQPECTDRYLKIDENDLVKTLGIFWHPSSDKFTFVVNFNEESTVSKRAYCAVIYVRSLSSDGRVVVKLLCSKSRVAPIKKTTLPRLELCAALLLAKLHHKIHDILNFKVNQTFYWSDSTITLYWIRSCPFKWKTFVAQRVTAIQEISHKESWLHVPTEHNPADLISRGLTPKKFIQSNLWVNGPSFLLQPAEFWPTLRDQFPAPDKTLEMTKITTVNVVVSTTPNILSEIKYHNDFIKLRQVVAYILRFKLQPKFKSSGPLKMEELERARHVMIRVVQKESCAELSCLVFSIGEEKI